MKTVIEMAQQVEAEGFAPVVIWPEVRRLCELVRADEREACAMRAWSSVLAMTDAETADRVLAVIRARSNT